MNKKILIIRHCERDDYIARLCYESWMLIGFEGEIIFYSEQPHSKKWLKNINAKWIQHPKVDNFMGQLGAWDMLNIFKTLDISDNDIVIQCDADIVMKSNPFTNNIKGCDIFGVGGYHKTYFHYNGELIFMSGKLVKEMKKTDRNSFEDIVWNEMIGQLDSVISDGHYFSYIAYKNKMKLGLCSNNWIHVKFFNYEPRIDFDNIINELKKLYPNER